MSTSSRIIQSESDHVRLKMNQFIEQRITPLFSNQWPLKTEQISSAQTITSPTNIAAIDFGTMHNSIVYKTEGDYTINY